MDLKAITQWLEDNMPGQYLCQEPMSKHTSFHIGGPADILAQPHSAEELCAVLSEARAQGIPVTIIGNGSNLLVRDNGVRGLVIKLGNGLKDLACSGTAIYAGSGVSLAAVSNYAASQSLTGLEFAVGIPGSLGGAIFMNAGAYDGEMKLVVTQIEAIDRDGRLHVLSDAMAEFGYRSSVFQHNGLIITGVQLHLHKGDSAAIKAKMAEFTQRRTTKQPIELPSAGSMFKRPVGHYAGTMIQEAGLKGYTVGGAQVSTKHAGFVVNIGNATAADVLQLINDVQDKVYAATGVRLEPEVRVIGE